jgi:hypothetical protein
LECLHMIPASSVKTQKTMRDPVNS